jgi:hypothetical protein
MVAVVLGPLGSHRCSRIGWFGYLYTRWCKARYKCAAAISGVLIVVKGEWSRHDGWSWCVLHWGGDEWVSQWRKGGKGDWVIWWCHLVVGIRAQVNKRFLLRLPARRRLVLLVIELGRRLLR